MKLWEKELFLVLAFLISCVHCVVRLECLVERKLHLMVHTVDLGSHASDFQTTSCASSWTNNATVVATGSNKNMTEPTCNFHVLVTSECHDSISWEGECWFERTLLPDYVANCSTTCADKSSSQGDKLNPEGDKQSIWIKVVVAGVFVLMGLLVIGLIYKFKGLHSMVSFAKRLYTPVPKEKDEERSNVSEDVEYKADALAVDFQ